MTATITKDVDVDPEVDPLVDGEKPKDKSGEKPEDDFDFEGWLDDIPQPAKDALSKRDEKKAKGLKSALVKERAASQEASRELEKKERERQASQESKMKEEGKFKELLEKNEKELAKLRASEEARIFRDEARQALKENDLESFSDVLMGPHATVEDIVETGETLKAMIEKQVDAEVIKRLNTGIVPKGGGTPIPTSKKLADMSEDDKGAFIKEHGLDKWTDLVQAAQGE